MDTSNSSTPSRRARWRKRLLTGLSSSGISVIFHLALVVLIIRFATGPRAPERQQEVRINLVDQAPPELEPLEELDPLEEFTEDMAEQMIQTPTEIQPEELDLVDTSTPDPIEDFSSVLTVPVLADNNLSSDQLKRGSGSAFGFGDKARGDLVGVMYDLKRDRSGRPRAVDYYADLRAILDEGLDAKAFNDFYRIPRPLYLSHLYVPYLPATSGPEAFGVADLMESRQWLVHYRGHLQTAIGGRYRFAGAFDDVLIVLVDGKVVHQFTWGKADLTPWTPTEEVGRHRYRNDQHLVYGDWFDLAPLRNRRVDILVGENPGGHVGGLLLIQREGETYETAEDGRPILPIFALQPLTDTEEERLYSQSEWRFGRRVPIMGARQDELPQNAARPNRDVTITIQ